jgi:hypothetical protein
MLPRIGIMRELNRHVERVFDPDRKGRSYFVSFARFCSRVIITLTR